MLPPLAMLTTPMDWPFLPHLHLLLLAQTPAPNPTSAEVEVLKSQLEFLKQSYSQFADTVRIIFTILGIAGAAIAYFFGKSFKDFQDAARKDVRDFQKFSRQQVKDAVEQVRQAAKTQITQLVETEVGTLIQTEVANVERTLRREQVVGRTIVDYYLPDTEQPPNEFALLQARNFRQVRFHSRLDDLERSRGDVIVLDLQNWITPSGQPFSRLPKEQTPALGRQHIDALLASQQRSTVIVVYTRSFIPYISEITDRYVIAANNPISLVGTVADAAYVVVGDRSVTQHPRQ